MDTTNTKRERGIPEVVEDAAAEAFASEIESAVYAGDSDFEFEARCANFIVSGCGTIEGERITYSGDWESPDEYWIRNGSVEGLSVYVDYYNPDDLDDEVDFTEDDIEALAGRLESLALSILR